MKVWHLLWGLPLILFLVLIEAPLLSRIKRGMDVVPVVTRTGQRLDLYRGRHAHLVGWISSIGAGAGDGWVLKLDQEGRLK